VDKWRGVVADVIAVARVVADSVAGFEGRERGKRGAAVGGGHGVVIAPARSAGVPLNFIFGLVAWRPGGLAARRRVSAAA
jgi:hypothetical protein